MTSQPLRISGDASNGFLSMDLTFTPATLEQIKRRDKICEETTMPIMREFGKNLEWTPIVKDGESNAKVLLVLDGANPTKMTVMEGTRIIDRGTGAKFIQKNSRFLHCQPEVSVTETTWMDSKNTGMSLLASSAVFRLPAPIC